MMILVNVLIANHHIKLVAVNVCAHLKQTFMMEQVFVLQ
jgi:hypothetical protein